MGLIPIWGTKILKDMWCGQKKKIKSKLSEPVKYLSWRPNSIRKTHLARSREISNCKRIYELLWEQRKNELLLPGKFYRAGDKWPGTWEMDQVFPGGLLRAKGMPTRLVHRELWEWTRSHNAWGWGGAWDETGEECVCVCARVCVCVCVCDRERGRS